MRKALGGLAAERTGDENRKLEDENDTLRTSNQRLQVEVDSSELFARMTIGPIIERARRMRRVNYLEQLSEEMFCKNN
jgi:hypothetical protein